VSLTGVSTDTVLHALWVCSGEVPLANSYLHRESPAAAPWTPSEDKRLLDNQNVEGLIDRKGRATVMNRLHFLCA